MTSRQYMRGMFFCCLAAWSQLEAAELSVSSATIVQGTAGSVVVSGAIGGESIYGLTVMLEVTPRTGATGSVEFTPGPPTDIAQLGDPWPTVGTFSAYDTDLSFSSTLNGIVDDNGEFVAAATTFSGALAGFPLVASPDAQGVWDVSVSTVFGASSWMNVSTTLTDGTITVLVPTAPTQPTGEAGYAKTRHISFVPGNAGQAIAIRVTLTATGIQDPAFQAAVGRQWWVGAPVEYCENGGQGSPPPSCSVPAASFMASALQCQPYAVVWDSVLGACGTAHVSGARIIPNSTYEIQVIPQGFDPNEPGNFSDPLIVTTSIWGDVAGYYSGGGWPEPDGSVDMTSDVIAVLDKYMNYVDAPIKTRSDVDPEDPNHLVNITDVTRINDAFIGLDYPFNAPSACD